MKWCFLANNATFLMQFLGKLSNQVVKEGDECIVLINSKVAEYGKKKYFPKEAVFFSKPDWCLQNYDPSKEDFKDLTWRELFSTLDRWPELDFSYEKSFAMVSQLYQFTDFILEKEKPDAVVTEFPAGLYNEIAKYLCGKKGIPYLSTIDSVFDRIGIYDKGWTDSRYEKDFLRINVKDIPESEEKFINNWLDTFLSHKKIPQYMKNIHVFFNIQTIVSHYVRRIREIGGVLLKYVMVRRQYTFFDYESEGVLKNSFAAPLSMMKRQFRIISQKKFYSHFIEKDEFFLFPLHVQPEASTSVSAPYYVNQLQTIKNIAFTIPFSKKLYVKEHPAAVGAKPSSFYKDLLKIPNVVVIDPKDSVQELIKLSKGVIVLTSTIGLEAALGGKPVYVFGNIFYSFHPMCRRLKNFDDLKICILEDMEKGVKIDNLKEINMRFLASCFSNTTPGSIARAFKENDANNYSEIYKALTSVVRA